MRALTFLKPVEIKAPSWMPRGEKLMFRRVVSQLNGAGVDVSEAQIDLIADYVEARLRIKALSDMLEDEIAAKSSFVVDKARILQLNGQINATTSLSHRIAEKLGLAK
jgi:phage terminase small subunit